jgi:hypothetical protein
MLCSFQFLPTATTNTTPCPRSASKIATSYGNSAGLEISPQEVCVARGGCAEYFPGHLLKAIHVVQALRHRGLRGKLSSQTVTNPQLVSQLIHWTHIISK